MRFLLTAAIIFVCIWPALATDFSKPILNIDGQPFTADGKPGSAPVTLADLVVNALLAPSPEDKDLTGTEKLRRFNLAMKVREAGAKDLPMSSEDKAYVEKLLARHASTVAYARAYELLEGRAQ